MISTEPQAILTPQRPAREPIYSHSRFHESGRLLIRAAVDWGHGDIDSETKDVCSEAEDNFFYSEDEEEVLVGLRRTLERRHAARLAETSKE